MRNKLVFKKLQKENIFNQDFIDFKKNNEIEFKNLHQNCIAVLYVPNGTGETSSYISVKRYDLAYDVCGQMDNLI